MSTPFLLYGSYGYTGALIADLAVRKGMQPVLSGRDADRVKGQASSLGTAYRALSLDATSALDEVLGDVPLVLNCAGPFAHTYEPLVKTCLRKGCHYLDITGEFAVFEALAGLDRQAKAAGVMLLPGVGLDVVPSDCLAAHLKKRLPDATQLTLALSMWGGSSRGTLLTGIEGLSHMGTVRRDGKLVQESRRLKTRKIDLGGRLQTVLGIPWGDLSTAYYSTGIPNIETYMAFPKPMLRLVRILSPWMGMGKTRFVQGLLKRAVMGMPRGPSEASRDRGGTRLWGEVRNEQGKTARSILETPEGHDFTAEAALAVVERVLTGTYKPGFQTPSLAYGADFILEFEGVTRQDQQVISI